MFMYFMNVSVHLKNSFSTLAKIIIAPNSVNKTSFLVIDFMDMVIRQLFVNKIYSKN